MAGWLWRLRASLGGTGGRATPPSVAAETQTAPNQTVSTQTVPEPQRPAAETAPALPGDVTAPESLILPPLPDSFYPRPPRRRRPVRLSYELDGAAPLAPHGAAMEAVKRRLLERVGEIGFDITTDPDLRLSIDGAERRVREVAGERHLFDVPAGACHLRLLSRVGVPREMFADSHDDRRLGVFVGRIVAENASTRLELALDDPSLVDGWYPPETEAGRPFRWTNGDAALPVTLDGLGPVTLVIEVRRVVPSWV